MPFCCSCTCWTPNSSQKDLMKQGLSVLLSCRLSGFFLGIGSFYFPEFRHGNRDPYEVVRDRPGVFLPQNTKNRPKIRSFEFKEILKKIEFNLIFTEFVLKIYIICCVPAQILYWEKSCS